MSRLAHAMSADELILPTGKIVVIGAPDLLDLQVLPRERTVLVVNFFPDHDMLKDSGWDVRSLPPGDVQQAEALGRFDLALVNLPRAKDAVRAALSLAAALSDHVVVNGAKVDGIESALREVKSRAAPDFVYSKAHGKVFGYHDSDTLQAWAERARPVQNAEGWWTAPGVFSADAPDVGSQALGQAIPPLKGRVVDLGSGWGYLSAVALQKSPDISEIHLVEADFNALQVARLNVSDPRASFHWADARTADHLLLAADAVIMNPPFHTGRIADPRLGQDFIRAAKAALKRDGILYMVANRQLPYEQVLTESFDLIQVMEGPTTSGFKLIRASGPRTRQRTGNRR